MTLPLCREKQKIAAAFGRAADRYDTLAYYQQNTGSTLLSLLDEAQAERRLHHPLKVLDAGCGTGFFSQIIASRGNEVTALDLSEKMLNVAATKNAASHYLCADMESLPINDEHFDVVFSNLSIQWCNNLNGALNELHRVTKRGGVIAFTTLAENSLDELSQAWQQFDGAPHVNTFLSDQKIAQSCQMWRCKLKKQADTLYFPHINALLNSLKGIGATHLTAGRKKGLITRQHLQQLASVYPLTDDGLPLTYHTIFGILYRD